MTLENAFNIYFRVAVFNHLLSNMQHKPIFCHIQASSLPDDACLYWLISVSTFQTEMYATAFREYFGKPVVI
jgi:hypothetical protein